MAELHSVIDYEAVLSKGLATKVDADYTSKGCPGCSHIRGDSHPNKGLIFHCVSCGFELNADLVEARNMTMRTIVSRQDWEATGRISAVPNVSSDEALIGAPIEGLRIEMDTRHNLRPRLRAARANARAVGLVEK